MISPATSSSWAGKARVMVGAMMEDTVANSTPFDIVINTLRSVPGPGQRLQCLFVQLHRPGVAAPTPRAATGGSAVMGPASSRPICPRRRQQGGGRGQGLSSPTTPSFRRAAYPGGAAEINKANDTTFMKRYFNDFRFLLKANRLSQSDRSRRADFWGEVQKVNSNPAAIAAAVASQFDGLLGCGEHDRWIRPMHD